MIPLRDLIAPCFVIDIREKCLCPEDGSCNYGLTVDDIAAFERTLGFEVPAGVIVIIRTGWAERWPLGARAYLGYDEAVQGPFDPSVSSLAFPSLSADAATLLVSRGVVGVGVDTASIDVGSSTDFPVHKILSAAGVYGIENINANVLSLPASGATLFVMPMKIKGGSGAPARVVALIPSN